MNNNMLVQCQDEPLPIKAQRKATHRNNINIPCSQEKWDPTSCIWTTPQPETRNIQRGYISTLVFNKMSSATMI